MSDLKLGLASTAAFFVIEKIITSASYNLLAPYCKEQKDQKLKEKRTTKAAHYVYASLYFVGIIIFGWIVIKDEPYYSKWLGGKGDLSLVWDKFPQ